MQGCLSQSLLVDSCYFAAAVAASVYSPVQLYSNPPSAVPVVLQVPDPLMSFIFPVPPAGRQADNLLRQCSQRDRHESSPCLAFC
jgi:hypothetical protein